MASVYKRGNILWVTWYDPIAKKKYSSSTGLEDSKANRISAKKMAEAQQKDLDEAKDQLSRLNLKRDTIQNAFNQHLANNSHKSKETMYEYNRFFRKFSEQFSTSDHCTTIDKQSVENWLNSLKGLPYSKNTLYTYYKQLINFLNFLFEYNYIQVFKINKNVKLKPEVKGKIIFSREDLDLIFEKLKAKNSNFQTMINVLFYTGLRESDIINLKAGDINLENNTFSYHSQKRKVDRRIAFHKILNNIFEPRITQVGEGRLFEYSNVHAMGRAFSRYLEQLKLNDKKYSLRTFRKTFQTLATAYGIQPVVIDELVGYEHQKTSNRHYVRVSLEMQASELEKFHRPQKGDVY